MDKKKTKSLIAGLSVVPIRQPIKRVLAYSSDVKAYLCYNTQISFVNLCLCYAWMMSRIQAFFLSKTIEYPVQMKNTMIS